MRLCDPGSIGGVNANDMNTRKSQTEESVRCSRHALLRWGGQGLGLLASATWDPENSLGGMSAVEGKQRG